MNEIVTPSNILFTLTILGVIFSIYRSYRVPQEETETKLAVGEERDKNKATILAQKEMENKASLLGQQVKIVNDQNENKFIEFGKRLDDSFLLATNHIHSVDVKVDVLTAQIVAMGNEITKLSTIIEERIPRRQHTV